MPLTLTATDFPEGTEPVFPPVTGAVWSALLYQVAPTTAACDPVSKVTTISAVPASGAGSAQTSTRNPSWSMHMRPLQVASPYKLPGVKAWEPNVTLATFAPPRAETPTRSTRSLAAPTVNPDSVTLGPSPSATALPSTTGRSIRATVSSSGAPGAAAVQRSARTRTSNSLMAVSRVALPPVLGGSPRRRSRWSHQDTRKPGPKPAMRTFLQTRISNTTW